MQRDASRALLRATVHPGPGDPVVTIDYAATRPHAFALEAPSGVDPVRSASDLADEWINALDAAFHPFAVERLRGAIAPEQDTVPLPKPARLTGVAAGLGLLARTHAPLRGTAVLVRIGAVMAADSTAIQAPAGARPMPAQAPQALRAAARAYTKELRCAWTPAVTELLAPWMRAAGLQELRIAGWLAVPTAAAA